MKKLILPTLILILSSGFAFAFPPSAPQETQAFAHDFLGTFQAITYTDSNGNIQRLEYDGDVWQTVQLTDDGSAAGNPVPFDNGVPNIVYRDANGNLQLLTQVGSGWEQRQITEGTAEAAKSDPTIYEFGTIHIIYQGLDDQVHDLLLDGDEQTHFVTTGGEAQKIAGVPTGFERNGEQHIVYRLQSGHINHMRYDGSNWVHNQISDPADPLPVGDPKVHFWGTQHLVYRADDNQLHELVLDGTTWTHYQLTFGTAQQATGGHVGFGTEFDGASQVIVYRGSEGQIHTLIFDGDMWNHAAFDTDFAPAAAADSGFSVHRSGAFHIVYRTEDNKLQELVFSSSGWESYQPIFQQTGDVNGSPAGYAHIATTNLPPTVPLRDLADARGIEIGPAVNRFAFDTDENYRPVLAEQFNILTGENIFKFGPIHPEPDVYDFEKTDELVQFAEDNNMVVRGHTFVWENQLPTWLEDGTWTQQEAIDIMEDHIATVGGRYAGRIKYWDVVNEAMDDGTGELRPNFWLNNVGASYLDIAFRAASEADPDAILLYNDYSISEVNQKSTAIYDMIVGMQARGVPIDAIGFQLHITTDNPPDLTSVRANMDRFAALGLDVHFTEIDIRILNGFEARPNKAVLQAQLYRDLLELCIDHPACSTYQMWGFTDAHTWVYDFFGGQYPIEAPLPFDPDYRPKLAYFGLVDALAPNHSIAYLPAVQHR